MARRIGSLLKGERGNVAVLMALLLVPLVGAVGLAVEGSSWLFMSRAAQNAADSAAVAAANNGGASALSEAQANVQQYGFASSAVTVTSPTTCPDGKSTCYSATVTRVMPIYLTRVVGFTGDTDLGGGLRGTTITSTAVAEALNAINFPSCMTALGSGQSISGDGGNFAEEPGCSMAAVGTNASIDCSGHTFGVNYGFATAPNGIGSPTGSGNKGYCVATPDEAGANFVFCNPYAAVVPSSCPASSIGSAVTTAANMAMTNPCMLSGTKNATTNLASSCYLSGSVALNGPIAGPATAGSGIVVVVENGTLDMGTYASTNVTWVFEGTGTTAPGRFADSTNINITAPGTGSATAGIAAYQIAGSCSSCDGTWNDKGSSSMNITGLLYLPYADVVFKGNAGHATSTGDCLVTVVNSFTTKGTGLVLDRAGCSTDGLTTLPQVQRMRAAIVQ